MKAQLDNLIGIKTYGQITQGPELEANADGFGASPLVVLDVEAGAVDMRASSVHVAVVDVWKDETRRRSARFHVRITIDHNGRPWCHLTANHNHRDVERHASGVYVDRSINP